MKYAILALILITSTASAMKVKLSIDNQSQKHCQTDIAVPGYYNSTVINRMDIYNKQTLDEYLFLQDYSGNHFEINTSCGEGDNLQDKISVEIAEDKHGFGIKYDLKDVRSSVVKFKPEMTMCDDQTHCDWTLRFTITDVPSDLPPEIQE